MKRLLLSLLCTCAFAATATAHVLDQYLQVAQLALRPDGVRVELRLIPGAQLAERVFALIDVDGDRQISLAEEQAYARRVLQDIALEVDGQRAALSLTRVQFPSRREMNEGLGAVRLELAAEAALDVTDRHQLSFHNDHLPELGVCMVNALVPTTEAIKITGQHRDTLQHSLQVNFRVLAADTHVLPHWTGMLLFGLFLALVLPLWNRLRSFVHRFEAEQIQVKRTFP